MSVYGGNQGFGMGGSGMSGPMQGHPVPSEHETVGAYALGILDDAEATAFEAHLATCEWCAQQLDELAGMEPMLAALADLPGAGTPAIGDSLSAKPSPRLVNKLVDEVAERRAQKRRRSFYMVAAAAALIVGGPFAAVAASGGDSESGGTSQTLAANPAKDLFKSIEDKVTGTDPSSKVTATVAMQEKAWGTETALELGGVKGPLKCSMIFVSKDGERETAASWSVPKWGYGIPDAKTEQARNPLYVSGGVSMAPDDVDHIEIMTFDGKKLADVDV
ncbi:MULTISPECIES: zf-HC2 domain-containing protein [unclassified Streptomyces]|uniref:zf-HC2 domain-containing protein n=1 Tax=unclassified Streptomyces TaxID=2593676 RepID=UPI0023663691|nr:MULTISPECIES: zf-HC2 domain-containing protein [unclassified Streptomyces]MDF3143731.1 zf-HC2 domain-containing protein [Streptomyces sp. T21Q-yed]WDF38485.1 zf-HC2 domain-containing protein [Streptomyces sp. T12]